MTTSCIVLAAGAGVRFGGNKLSASVNGSPIIEYIFGNLPTRLFKRVVVVTADPTVMAAAQRHGFALAFNDRPDLGISRSIRLGLNMAAETDACMFCVADQPLVRQETLVGMLEAYEHGTILMVSHNGQSGNPVIFPSCLFGELMSLSGEESGKTAALRHKDLIRLLHVADAHQLMDIDTRDDLKAVEARLSGSVDTPST
jgi:molybdenum cofactor cytidylyltransferase